MGRILCFLMVVSFSLPALAKTRRIHSITHTFVKFTSGEVGFLDDEAIRSFAHLELVKNQLVDSELDLHHSIKSLTVMPLIRNEELDHPKGIEEQSATVLPNYSSAQKLLNGFNRNYLKESECYDRAHVWSYEALQKNETTLSKSFIFFSDHYIEEYRFQWWFHVAPVVKVIMKGNIEERVMDARFSKYPLKTKLWTDLFMRNKVECQETDLYTDYSEHPGEAFCYLIKTSIHYWQPKDLELFAKRRVEKSYFIDWEIKHAYENAFGIK